MSRKAVDRAARRYRARHSRPDSGDDRRHFADAYDVTGTDGSRPDCWGYLAAYGWEREDGEGVDKFR